MIPLMLGLEFRVLRTPYKKYPRKTLQIVQAGTPQQKKPVAIGALTITCTSGVVPYYNYIIIGPKTLLCNFFPGLGPTFPAFATCEGPALNTVELSIVA